MKTILTAMAALVAACLYTPAQAALKIFACEPEWAVLAQELGGDKLEAYSATTALQDPHSIQARPSLIAKARQADLVICSGAELESGWLPQVLRQAANGKVQPGMPGYLEVAPLVPRLEVPAQLDRSGGDIHATGNPHVQYDPRNFLLVATALSQRLAQLDTANAADYRSRHEAFTARWNAAILKWSERAAPLKGMRVVIHHDNLVYLLNWLGIEEVGQLEPKPGIPPTIAHMQQLLDALSRRPARVILRMPYEDERPSRWLSERSGTPTLMLPGTVGGAKGADDLFGLFEATLDSLLAATQ